MFIICRSEYHQKEKDFPTSVKVSPERGRLWPVHQSIIRVPSLRGRQSSVVYQSTIRKRFMKIIINSYAAWSCKEILTILFFFFFCLEEEKNLVDEDFVLRGLVCSVFLLYRGCPCVVPTRSWCDFVLSVIWHQLRKLRPSPRVRNLSHRRSLLNTVAPVSRADQDCPHVTWHIWNIWCFCFAWRAENVPCPVWLER